VEEKKSVEEEERKKKVEVTPSSADCLVTSSSSDSTDCSTSSVADCSVRPLTSSPADYSEDFESSLLSSTAVKKQMIGELCVLTAPSKEGATRLEVNHVHGRSVNELIVINRGQKTAELATMTVVGTGAVTVNKPLLHEHVIGEEVDFADINDDYISALRFAETFSTAFRKDTTRLQVNQICVSGLTTTTDKAELDKILMPPPPPR
jgi:hypothetical protein